MRSPTSRPIATAQRFLKEAGCDAVKLEGGGVMVDRARAIAATGIPVVGHVGLTPQTATALGGFKAQARTAERAQQVIEHARALEEAGCCLIVFEAIPAAVTEVAMEQLSVPVIGIGAGAATDGQVLVWHDLLGLYEWGSPRFVKRYADLRPADPRRAPQLCRRGARPRVPRRRVHVLDRPRVSSRSCAARLTSA